MVDAVRRAAVRIVTDLSEDLEPRLRYARIVGHLLDCFPVHTVALGRWDSTVPERFTLLASMQTGQPAHAEPQEIEGSPWLGAMLEGGKVSSTSNPTGDCAFACHGDGSTLAATAFAIQANDETLGFVVMAAEDATSLEIVERAHTFYAPLVGAAVFTTEMVASLDADAARMHRLALEVQEQEHRRLAVALLGGSVAIRNVRKALEEAANKPGPFLLLGPAGAGKEAAARLLHETSDRHDEPFLVVHGALARPGDFALSEAASPASLAVEGSLLIRHIQHLSPEAQVALARLLDTPEDMRPVVLGTSTVELGRGVAPFDSLLARRFRMHNIRLPSLRERTADIPMLGTALAANAARRLSKPPTKLSSEAMEALQGYGWPGNVDEMEAVIERAMMWQQGDTLDIDPALLERGRKVGRYHVTSILGEGGMGEVWRAKHHLMARDVAVKTIRRARLGKAAEDTLALFRKEARITAQLRSPYTVALYDFGIDEEGMPFYVMECLDGIDGEAIIRRFGPVEAARAAKWMFHASSSLAEAHGAGLVHRDIKPANLMINRSWPSPDACKVLDFGMVRELHRPPEEEPTLSSVAGTPAFLAPEVSAGQEHCPQSDIYALGCTAFWFLTGSLVFEGASIAELAIKHETETPLAPSMLSELPIPEAFDDLILRCLAKNPAERPASAYEVRETLASMTWPSPWSHSCARRWWRSHAPEGSDGANGGPR